VLFQKENDLSFLFKHHICAPSSKISIKIFEEGAQI